MDGLWLDITKPQRLPETARATISWRVPGKGRPLAEIGLSVGLIAQLGWKPGETRLRIFASADRAALRFQPDAGGKLLTAHGGAGSIAVMLDWVTSGKRSSEVLAHMLHHDPQGGYLTLILPGWSRGTPALAAPEAETLSATTPAAEKAPYTEQWTPEREKLAVSLWDDPEISMAELQARVNALPGKYIAASYLLYKHAKRLQLSNPRPYATAHVRAEQPLPPLPPLPGPEPEPAPLPPPGPAAASTTNDPGAKLRLTPSVTRAGEAISARDQEKRISDEIAEYLATGMRGRAIADEMRLPLSEVLAHIAAIEAKQRAARDGAA